MTLSEGPDRNVEWLNADGREKDFKYLWIYSTYSVFRNRLDHFAGLILKNKYKPAFLFKTINSVLNPSPCSGLEALCKSCNDFLTFFISKVEIIRIYITITGTRPSIFKSVNRLKDWLNFSVKCSTSAMDVLPSWFFKEIFDIISNDELQYSHWYSSWLFQTGCSSTSLKERYWVTTNPFLNYHF